jgi:streptogrisin C
MKVNPAMLSAAQRDLGLSATQATRWLQLQGDAPAKAALAQQRLGARYAGSWIERGADDEVRLIVASSDPRAQLALEGVQLRKVRYSLVELEAAKARLDRSARARVSGISRPLDGVHAWHVDPASNSVLISVAPERMERAIDFAAASGAATGLLRFTVMEGEPQATASVYAGRAYQKNGAASCSVGFAVRQGATKGFVTAGHCGTVGESIWLDGAPAGYIAASEYPVADRAWVALGAQHDVLPWVSNYAGAYFYVRGSNEAHYSAIVCRSGWKTGYQCGYVIAKNVSVNVAGGGMVYGLTQTNACAGFGDSGGGWIDVYEHAQGVTSAANILPGAEHNCGQFMAATWFQPVNPILEQYGLSLVTL